MQELHALFANAAAGAGSSLEKVLHLMRGYYVFVIDHPAYFGFIAFFESPLPVTYAGVVYETTNAIYDLFQTVLQQGMADGSVRTDLKANLLANLLWASSYGIMQFMVSKRVHPAEQPHINSHQLSEAFLTTLVSGLGNPRR